MKPRYVIRIEEHTITVEHRARLRWQTLALGTAGFLLFSSMMGLPGIFGRPMGEMVVTFGAMLLFYVALVALLSAFPLYMRAEVLHCDTHELRLARRKVFQRWHRMACATRSVEELRLIQHGGRNRRQYRALSFRSRGTRYEMLEQIGSVDAERVMAACEALGANLFVDPEDKVSAPMHADIAERGWWVKPWKQD